MYMKWMFRIIAGLFLWVWMAGTAQAQSPGPALWEVRDGDAGLVIMGSVHMLRPGTRWLRPEIGQRFDEASTLVLEIADLQEAEAVTTPIVLRKGLYPPGQSLADELSLDTFERAVALAEELGAGTDGFVRMRPWLAGIFLTQLWAASHGYDPGCRRGPVFQPPRRGLGQAGDRAGDHRRADGHPHRGARRRRRDHDGTDPRPA
jgi:uncharacterized protein